MDAALLRRSATGSGERGHCGLADPTSRAGSCSGHEPLPRRWGRGRRPVIKASWDDAWAYADWPTGRTGEELPSYLSEAEVRDSGGDGDGAVLGESAQQQYQCANGYDAHGACSRPKQTARRKNPCSSLANPTRNSACESRLQLGNLYPIFVRFVDL